MRDFNYSEVRERKWDSDLLGLIAAIYKEAGKQELYLKQRPQELEKLVDIAKVQSTEASNSIEGIVTTNTRIRQLVAEKTTPKNRNEREIAGYRDVLGIIHESFDAISICLPRFFSIETKLPALDMVRMATQNKIGRFTKQDIRELCPSLSVSSIEGALRKLVASGKIRREGNGKNTHYYRIK